jgi:hypothetical protein
VAAGSACAIARSIAAMRASIIAIAPSLKA